MDSSDKLFNAIADRLDIRPEAPERVVFSPRGDDDIWSEWLEREYKVARSPTPVCRRRANSLTRLYERVCELAR